VAPPTPKRYLPPVLASLLAIALAAVPGSPETYDPFEEEAPASRDRPRLALTAWGGSYLGAPGSNRSSGSLLGGEATWSFDSIDLGAQATWAQVRDGSTALSPVLLLRIGQRFRTRRGLEASFSLGIGAGRPERWEAWFQVALGVRFDVGPIFLTSELALEQSDLIRLAGGVGVRF
jgi:hypothetical protein